MQVIQVRQQAYQLKAWVSSMIPNQESSVGTGEYRIINQSHRLIFLVSCVCLATLLAGCASPGEKQNNTDDSTEATEPVAPYEQDFQGDDVVEFEPSPDPLERVNRLTFVFNDVTYHYLFIPAAKQYQKLPEFMTGAIGHFFSNLGEPLSAGNHLLQGDVGDMTASIVRFGVNSTVGLLGVFDVSKSALDIEKRETDFADTLSTWGVGAGPYVVIPLLGPSDFRGGGSLLVNGFANPIRLVPDREVRLALLATDAFQSQASTIVYYDDLVEEIEDPYVFLRELYVQSGKRDEYKERLRTETENKP
ncbi:MlaA family lipoprotein [Reinekea thalattae]|uniref:VacJ family lipoprotein n=1 Tax=Reinekea thalattae TaxID=2593301 RepID=A0A5C8Z1G9_9GAMM|nr:VacJ family lipoprotein [Reinekea thalattae]TXR51367.1 VacJ family lipoprotein [Reinekea thalattae]